MVVLVVIMYISCTWYIQMNLNTYTNPSWTHKHEDEDQVLPIKIGHFYPLYPSSLNFKCVNWSILYKNITNKADDGSKTITKELD